MSTTGEIEENAFFPHENRLFRQLLDNIGNCYEQYFYGKINKEISQLRPMKMENGDFRYSSLFSAGKNLLGIANTHICVKKSKNTNEEIREITKKLVFPAYFRKSRKVFSKIRLCHI